MLVTLSGPLGNFFRLQPPLTIKTNQIDHFVTTFNTVLQRVRTTVQLGLEYKTTTRHRSMPLDKIKTQQQCLIMRQLMSMH